MLDTRQKKNVATGQLLHVQRILHDNDEPQLSLW